LPSCSAGWLVFVYHCFDRMVINGYLSGLPRPEQVVYFFPQVIGVSAVTKEVLSQRTGDYQGWVESFARNHELIEWGEKGVRKEEYVRRWQRRWTVLRQHPIGHRDAHKNSVGLLSSWLGLSPGRFEQIKTVHEHRRLDARYVSALRLP
jgi:hypothetical protein